MAWAREESSGQNQAIFWKAELTELWVESMEDVMESRELRFGAWAAG